MAQRKEKKKLSKHLLEMKFMKSSKERIEEEEDEEECRALFGGKVSDDQKSTSNYVIQHSWVHCEGLKGGRRSFRGMNPIIERIMALENAGPVIKKEIKEEDVDVTVEEMAKFKQEESTLIETVAKKFRSRNRNSSPPRKKLKFLKPKDE